MDAARAVEMAGDALSRNSAADRADRERRITEENHVAENKRFLAAREDDIAEWFTDGGGQFGVFQALQAAFGEKTRTVFLRTGDLAASQNIALADLRREGLSEDGKTVGETMEFRPGCHCLPDHNETMDLI